MNPELAERVKIQPVAGNHNNGKKNSPHSITLVPITFRMVVSVGKEPAMISDAIFLRGEARLQRRESIKLTTEENFHELDGVLELLEQQDGAPTDENANWLASLLRKT